MNKEHTIRKLTELKTQDKGVVAKMKLPEEQTSRLIELGLRVGCSVRVLAGGANDGILLAVGDGRIGVNFDVARKIYVF